MAFQLRTDGKLSILVHLQKCFSPTEIINEKTILEGMTEYWFDLLQEYCLKIDLDLYTFLRTS